MSDSGYWHEVGFGAKKGLTGVVIHVWEQGIVYSQYWQDDKFSKVLLQMEHDGKVCCLPITERGVKVETLLFLLCFSSPFFRQKNEKLKVNS